MKNKQWKTVLAESSACRSDIEGRLSLEEKERAFFEDSRVSETFPFRVTEYYLSLAGTSPDNPVRRQCIPTAAEYETLPYEAAGAVTDTELDAVCRYLRHETDVKELLLSGGGPLLLDERRLEEILTALRKARPDMVFRLATRAPVTLPARVTGELTRIMAAYFPLWVVTQFNHPAEITPQSSAAVGAFRAAGIPCVNQTVLLKGVNDSSDILAELFRGLVAIGVKPYYLFQGDLARGTAHFRTPLETGWRIMAELRGRLSGLAVPVYAVDLPGGGGKIVLDRGSLVQETADGYTFRGFEGGIYTYPKEGHDEQ